MQTILLTASINKLSVTRDEAEDYAALIMESVDNKNKGYIEVLLYFFVIRSVEISHFIYIESVLESQTLYLFILRVKF
jgi:respiratory burst oxidase